VARAALLFACLGTFAAPLVEVPDLLHPVYRAPGVFLLSGSGNVLACLVAIATVLLVFPLATLAIFRGLAAGRPRQTVQGALGLVLMIAPLPAVWLLFWTLGLVFGIHPHTK
jgi:hypothetical protein